jgi:hypothetical protein
MADLSETTFAPHISSPQEEPASSGTFGIVVGVSPFAYTAPYRMAVIVSGGAVSLMSYGRGASTATLGLTNGIIELNKGDVLNVTYAVTTPTMTGIPR